MMKITVTFNDVYYLSAAKPYFLLPLDHKHLDEGADVTWRCLAYGKPTPVYSWYKNGVLLQPTADSGITVRHVI